MAQFNRHLSCLDIVKRVTGRMGLPVPVAVAAQTNDKLATQLLYLLNDAGTRLLKPTQGYRWQVLKRTWEFTTVPAQTLYDLPEDWDAFLDQTAYSKDLSWPLMGPIGDGTWAFVQARTVGPIIRLMYRTRGDKFEIFTAPATPQTLMIDYSSRGWVKQMADPVGYKDECDKDDDLPLYDSGLITAALRLRMLQEKGFDTTTAQNDYDLALELAINSDTDAPILNPSGGQGEPLLGVWNLPETGLGV